MFIKNIKTLYYALVLTGTISFTYSKTKNKIELKLKNVLYATVFQVFLNFATAFAMMSVVKSTFGVKSTLYNVAVSMDGLLWMILCILNGIHAMSVQSKIVNVLNKLIWIETNPQTSKLIVSNSSQPKKFKLLMMICFVVNVFVSTVFGVAQYQMYSMFGAVGMVLLAYSVMLPFIFEIALFQQLVRYLQLLQVSIIDCVKNDNLWYVIDTYHKLLAVAFKLSRALGLLKVATLNMSMILLAIYTYSSFASFALISSLSPLNLLYIASELAAYLVFLFFTYTSYFWGQVAEEVSELYYIIQRLQFHIRVLKVNDFKMDLWIPLILGSRI